MNSWILPVRSKNNIDIWKEKVKRLKRALKGWNINEEGKNRRKINTLKSNLNRLDIKSESTNLSEEEKDEKMDYEFQLKNLLLEEETKMKQIAREKNVMARDENTKYFHLKANGNKRRLRIHSLLDNGLLVDNEDEINKLATNYYRDLFGPSNVSNIHMNDMNMRKLNDDDRKFLTAPFSLDEIHKVVSDLKHNCAPGPDGLPAEFFQDFWDIIKKDLWNMCDDFNKGTLDIKRLNYGLITLIPKVDNAMEMKNFRPICLLNVCYKIMTKTLNNRLSTCINKVISENQFGFVKCKYILDCVVALHEIIHEIKKKKQNGIILKIDFEKAYDKVNWYFLYNMLQQKGFGDRWCDWVMKIVKGGKVAIRTNGMIGSYFPTHKGVRQGDPFSPLLFNIAADGLACLIEKAQEKKLIAGLIPHIIKNECAYLQYADDTILLLQDNLKFARNLKFILILFEKNVWS
jgi:hypothetical protein